MSPKTRNIEHRREAILEAAHQLMSEKGLAGTRMQEVAQLARVSKGSLYELADSKLDLFFMVCLRQLESELERIYQSALDESDPVARLRAIVFNSLPTKREAPGSYAMRAELFALSLRNREIGRKMDSVFKKMIDELNHQLAEYIKDGINCGALRADLDPETITTIIRAWMNHTWLKWIIMPSMTVADLQERAERFLAFLIPVIVKKETGGR